MSAPNNRKCQVEDCGRKHHANNYCQKHNRQVYEHGHILTGNYLSEQGKKARAVSSGSKGKHWSEAAKQRYSEAYKGIRKNSGKTHFAKGHEPWSKGVALSQKTKNKISNAKTKYTDIERTSNKVLRMRARKLRNLVLARDSETCQICLSITEYPQVDHIKSWKDYPELRFDINNLRTLCMPCHYYVTYKKKIPQDMFWGHRRPL